MSGAFIALQRALPHHALSRLGGRFANSKRPWLKNLLIQGFVKAYGVTLEEASVKDFAEFDTYNAFFTRALEPDVRPLGSRDEILSPADGTISQVGSIENGTLLQAKGAKYPLESLTHDAALAEEFRGGSFATVYLAPNDYHRVHTPIAGTITDTVAVPGALYSVNSTTEASIPSLFCQNERLVCALESAIGPVLVVLVGAMIVASIETVWGAPASPYTHIEHGQPGAHLDHGEELGRFLLGSTVICCFPKGAVALNSELAAGSRVKVGEAIGTIVR